MSDVCFIKQSIAMPCCTRLLEQQQQHAALTAAVTIVGCFQLTQDISLKRINYKTMNETEERVHMRAASLVPVIRVVLTVSRTSFRTNPRSSFLTGDTSRLATLQRTAPLLRRNVGAVLLPAASDLPTTLFCARAMVKMTADRLH